MGTGVFGEFIKDPKEWKKFGQGIADVAGRGMFAGTVGLPADLYQMGLNQFLPSNMETENPVGGSEWIGQKLQDAGIVSEERRPIIEAVAGMFDPAIVAAKAPMLASQIGMFLGKGAKNADLLALKKAQALEGTKTPEDIWRDTGWFKGVDGKWRFEISDEPAKMLDVRETHPFSKELLDEGSDTTSTDLDKIIEHKELSKNYDILDPNEAGSVIMRKDLYPRKGSYQEEFDEYELPLNYGESEKDVTLHEIQHAIQGREGWAKGGSPRGEARELQAQRQGFPSVEERDARVKELKETLQREGLWSEGARDLENKIKILENPSFVPETWGYERYRNLAGEAEARATERRMNMTDAERRAKFPFESYDVPKEELIVKGMY